jgi:hypothetical protein
MQQQKILKNLYLAGVKQEGRNLESGEAIWLSPNKEYQPAMHNISGKEGKFREGTNVMPVYVSAKEPLLLDDDISLNWARDVFANGSMEFPHLMAKKWINAVKKSGYDSIIYDDPNKTGDVNNIEYLVFEPNQIKSAIGNRGTFSLTSDSIDEETVANNLVKSTKPIGKEEKQSMLLRKYLTPFKQKPFGQSLELTGLILLLVLVRQ